MDFSRLWEAADKLRVEMNSVLYRKYILQLIFLKHISNQTEVIDLAIELFEPRKLNNPLQHRLAYYQFSNGGMSNDNE